MNKRYRRLDVPHSDENRYREICKKPRLLLPNLRICLDWESVERELRIPEITTSNPPFGSVNNGGVLAVVEIMT